MVLSRYHIALYLVADGAQQARLCANKQPTERVSNEIKGAIFNSRTRTLTGKYAYARHEYKWVSQSCSNN